jgi:ABC-type multidrug transport system ATPase subunit
MTPALEIINLSKSFNNLKAVNDVSFSVRQGEICGFLGPNGAGKSTTLRTILTLIYPDTGTILVQGHNVFKERRKALSHVGALIERADFYRYLSAYDTLSLLASYHKLRVGAERIMELLRLVGLEDRAHSKVKTFSQGMKQRLGIAQALLHNPDIVILDEPTNGLDPAGMVDMRHLILRLCKDMGKTVLLSSHILNEVEMVADAMVIIHKGQIMAAGTVAELLGSDEGTVWVGWEKAPDELLDAFRKSLMPDKVRSLMPDGAEFRVAEKDIPDLLAALLGLGFRIVEVQKRRSLEQLFLKMTAEANA